MRFNPEQIAAEKENLPVLEDDVQGFKLQRTDDKTKDVEIIAKKDERGDYPNLYFSVTNAAGESVSFSLNRDELSAITFALSRQDQQSKLLGARFREYKEVPVRLVVEAKKDIKKGELLVVYRREKVPIEFEYSKSLI